jgi:hypothetical protein
MDMEADEADITQPSPPPIDALPRPTLPTLSSYERESEHKASPTVAARRKALRTYVASVIGVAWVICQCALGESALRSMLSSLGH